MQLARRVSLLAVAASMTLLFGCASIDKAAPEADAAAKQFKSNPANSQIYVYRNESMGAALSMPVTVDGKLAGTTGPNSFFKFDLPAGKHTLTSQKDESVLDVNTKNGEIYYVWQEVKMGMMSGGSKLQLVEKDKGQKGVAECKLIQSKF